MNDQLLLPLDLYYLNPDCSVVLLHSVHRDEITMRRTSCLALANCRQFSRTNTVYHWQRQSRSIATHTFSHHASALSVLPTNVDTSLAEFKENAAQFGELLASMRELHQKIEQGGAQKAREKHVARGKMLPREYVTTSWDSCAEIISTAVELRPS